MKESITRNVITTGNPRFYTDIQVWVWYRYPGKVWIQISRYWFDTDIQLLFGTDIQVKFGYRYPGLDTKYAGLRHRVTHKI